MLAQALDIWGNQSAIAMVQKQKQHPNPHPNPNQEQKTGPEDRWRGLGEKEQELWLRLRLAVIIFVTDKANHQKPTKGPWSTSFRNPTIPNLWPPRPRNPATPETP